MANPADAGSQAADAAVDEIEKKIITVYRRAYNEVRATIIEFNANYKLKSEQKQKLVADGKMSQEDYNKWEAGQKFQSRMWNEKKAHLLSVVTNANIKAAEIINGKTANVFATSANYQCYQIDQDTKGAVSFSLYDSNTVARLIKDNPQLLPHKEIDPKKDKAWNKKKVNAAIQQGILQGKSIPQIADYMAASLSESNRASVVRAARTAMTGAENAGRIEGMKQAKSLGIDVRKQWLAAHDARVRDTHVMLDGQIAEVEEPFKVTGQEIMFPGDPTAAPALVYNCRCTLKYVYPKFTKAGKNDYYIDKDGNKKAVTDQTFAEWVAQKEQEKAAQEAEAAAKAQAQAHHAELVDKYNTLNWAGMIGKMINPDYPFADLTPIYNEMNALALKYSPNNPNPNTVWTKYLAGELDDEDMLKLDGYLDSFEAWEKSVQEEEAKKAAEEAAKKAAEIANHQQELSNQFAGMSVYDALAQMNSDGYNVGKVYNDLSDLAAKNFTNAEKLWTDYLNGNLSQDDTEAINKILDDYNVKKKENEEKKAAEEAAKKAAEELEILNHQNTLIAQYANDDYTNLAIDMGLDGFDFSDVNQQFTEIAQKENLPDAADVWKLYLNGGLSPEDAKKINDILDKYEELKKTNAANAAALSNQQISFEYTHQEIIDSYLKTGDFEFDFWEAMDAIDTYPNGLDSFDFKQLLGQYAEEHGGLNNMTGQQGAYNAYISGKMEPEWTEKIDKAFLDIFEPGATLAKPQEPQEEMIGGFPKSVIKKKIDATDFWDVTDQLYESGNMDAAHKWQQIKSDYFHQNGYTKNVLEAYKDGTLDADTASQIEELFALTIKDTGDPKGHIDAYTEIQGKKITEFKKEMASVNNKVATDFGKELKSIGDDMGIAPKDVFELYKKDALPAEDAKKLDNYVNNYLQKKAAGETHTVKHHAKKGTTPTVSDAELHKTFSGIWKDDVTYADWDEKKDKIQAKKDYFKDQIQKAEANGDMTAKAKFEGLLADLEEFEKYGPEYSAILAAQTASGAASGGLGGINSTGATGGLKPLTEAEKKAALDFLSGNMADKHHRKYLDQIWDTLSDEEKYGVWEYTRNSNPLNKPLSGYTDTWRRNSFIGIENTVWGYEDSWRDLDVSDFRKFGVNGHVSYHKAISAATRAIEKSRLPETCWLVRGSDENGLAGLFEGNIISFDQAIKLLDGTTSGFEKLKKIVMDQDFVNHAFTSTGIAKGKGFGGNVKYRILAPAGTKGIYAEPQSYWGDTSSRRIYKKGKSYGSVSQEAEIIIQRGTKYRVADFTMDNYGNYEITLEIVEQPSYFKYGDEDTYNDGKTRHKK